MSIRISGEKTELMIIKEREEIIVNIEETILKQRIFSHIWSWYLTIKENKLLS